MFEHYDVIVLRSNIPEMRRDDRESIDARRDAGIRREIKEEHKENTPEGLRKIKKNSDDISAYQALKALEKMKGNEVSFDLLSYILNKKDVKKFPRTVREAAFMLAKFPANAEQKKEIQQIFLKTLNMKYPEAEGNPPIALRRSLRLAALSGLEGYTGADAIKPFMTLARNRDEDKDIRVQAILRLSLYPEAQDFLYTTVFSVDDYLEQPQVMAAALSALRKSAYQEKVQERARTLLFKKKLLAHSDCEVFRIALTETILDEPESARFEDILTLMKEDKSWRVRRAVLSRLAARGGENFMMATRIALDDPQPFIRQLAIASAVALTAKPMECKEYLRRLSAAPTPLTCAEIFKAENISHEISLLPREKVREILQNRGMASQ
ncbi:MAG TPA: hypothetical protein PLI82_07585 [Candidatus Sumerlaeota bacterium]|nr:hypothetical protein [Candidatus Sumerlaeota bacterium]HON50442.1 hypothetical protein [Candidatus Sumerlaeota bacterium]HOR63658.1 hypothetical protein [Candidatus Sumerlaeota bacterium]HRR31211.1 hypothetical protein [Candidatus Sumerlaeia bacterium]HRU53148.1 hypothetical protein [Candidatus Sumerlaeia bacterium]